MTSQPADQATTQIHSRRAMLGAALGAGAAAAASVLAASPVLAVNGDTVTVGGAFSGSATTQISATGTGGVVKAVASSASGIGLYGQADGGTGVKATTATGTALDATATGSNGIAVSGSSASGVAGTFTSSTGMGLSVGANGTTGIAAAISGTGGLALWVRGKNGIDVSAVETNPDTRALSASHGQGTAIQASSTSSYGVCAQSSSGIGVYGTSTSAQGVYGESLNGTGVLARSITGTALKVEGKAAFSRSGKVDVLATKASVVITVPGGVTSSTLAFANLAYPRTGVWIRAVRPNYPAGKVTVYLNKAVSAKTPVAWFVLG